MYTCMYVYIHVCVCICVYVCMYKDYIYIHVYILRGGFIQDGYQTDWQTVKEYPRQYLQHLPPINVLECNHAPYVFSCVYYSVVCMSIHVDLATLKISITSAKKILDLKILVSPCSAAQINDDMCHESLFRPSQKLAVHVCPISKVWTYY